MLRNIPRHRRFDQMVNALPMRHTVTDRRGADVHAGHLDRQMRYFTLCFWKIWRTSPYGICAVCYQKRSKLEDVGVAVPLLKKIKLVLADQQEKRRIGLLMADFNERVIGIARARALGFARIHARLRQVSESQLQHLHAMFSRAQAAALVPSLAHGQKPQLV